MTTPTSSSTSSSTSSPQTGRSQLRRPKNECGSVAVPIILNALDCLPLDDEDAALEASKALAIQVKDACTNGESLTTMLHGIHNHSLESESSAQRSAILFCSLSQLEIDQVKCRNTFLKKIQIDYDNRKQLQGHNQQSYLNLVTLLCQVFRRVRVADGSTIAALCGPILECLSELLEFPTNEGLLVFSKQIQIIGPELKRLKPQELAILLNKLRTCLIHTSRNASVSSQSVASLLLVLEASHSHTWKLSEDEETFYSVNIPTASRMTPMEVSQQQQLLQQQQQTQQHHHLQHQLLQQPLDGVLMSDPNLGSSGVSGLLPPHAQLGQKPTDNAGLNDIATRLLATALHQQPTAPAGIIPPPFGGIGPANPAVGIPNLSMPPPGYLSSAHPPGVPNPLLPIVPPAGINGQRNSAGFQDLPILNNPMSQPVGGRGGGSSSWGGGGGGPAGNNWNDTRPQQQQQQQSSMLNTPQWGGNGSSNKNDTPRGRLRQGMDMSSSRPAVGPNNGWGGSGGGVGGGGGSSVHMGGGYNNGMGGSSNGQHHNNHHHQQQQHQHQGRPSWNNEGNGGSMRNRGGWQGNSNDRGNSGAGGDLGNGGRLGGGGGYNSRGGRMGGGGGGGGNSHASGGAGAHDDWGEFSGTYEASASSASSSTAGGGGARDYDRMGSSRGTESWAASSVLNTEVDKGTSGWGNAAVPKDGSGSASWEIEASASAVNTWGAVPSASRTNSDWGASDPASSSSANDAAVSSAPSGSGWGSVNEDRTAVDSQIVSQVWNAGSGGNGGGGGGPSAPATSSTTWSTNDGSNDWNPESSSSVAAASDAGGWGSSGVGGGQDSAGGGGSGWG